MTISSEDWAHNCPILERTADGCSVGRCWFWCSDGTCPRHGNVCDAIERHRRTGKLTDEFDHRPRRTGDQR